MAGNLVTLPFVDPHVHLDAVLVAGKLPRGNVSGTLLEAIEVWGEWKAQLTDEILMDNAREVMKWYVANGVLRVRTHADCTDKTLRTVKCLLALREERKNKNRPPHSANAKQQRSANYTIYVIQF